MPELPEVETVRRTLERYLQDVRIEGVKVHYDKILANETKKSLQEKLKGQTIRKMGRRGKWLIFELDDYDFISHLRMEGKYFFKLPDEERSKHEHVVFLLSDGRELRYHDTRKFGRMYLFPKDTCLQQEPLSKLGKEPWDDTLTSKYLMEQFQKRNIPIKTVLLDQSVITGIGNIYADEILFKAHIHPLTIASSLTKQKCEKIRNATREILEEAISMGGTTIRSYESEKGVHGKFQQNLKIHNQKVCATCGNNVERIFVGGRSTYFCQNCQKK